MLKAVEGQTATALGPLLTAALAPQSPLRAFDLLGNVLLHEVDMALITHMPGGRMRGAMRFAGHVEGDVEGEHEDAEPTKLIVNSIKWGVSVVQLSMRVLLWCLAGVFSPGVPHAFHSNFLAAQVKG